MISWILIYSVFTYQGVATGQVGFYNAQSCDAAKAQLEARTDRGRVIYEATCVRNGG